MNVKVTKTLNWEPFEDPEHHAIFAYGLCGARFEIVDAGGEYRWGTSGGAGVEDSWEAAKAAAQGHFEAELLSGR